MERSNIGSLVIDDRERGLFRVNRRAFVDPAILEIEKRQIFDRCWLYACHESEVAKPGDFLTRSVGGRPLLFVRDAAGSLGAFFNSCPHRGNVVCRERSGSARGFTCFYHAWSFNLSGALVGLPGEEAYSPAWNRAQMGLRRVPRVENYRGMVFVCFDASVVDLVTYFGPVREYLDYMLDFGGTEVEIAQGTQAFSMRANWKLLVENSQDPYHALPTHQRYFRQYLPDLGIDNSKWVKWDTGVGVSLNGGHTLIEFPNPPTPLTHYAGKELAEIRSRLVEKFGEERASKIADYNRNMFIFPNLILISLWRSVRTFYPLSPDYMEINEWGLFPRGESRDLRSRRIESFMSFLGPAGFGTPDDHAGLEGCQRGFATVGGEDVWTDLSRNMSDPVPPGSGEIQMRGFWRRWNALINGDTALPNPSDRMSASLGTN